MELLSDEKLKEAYSLALKLKLDLEFIILLEQEMKNRGLLENNLSNPGCS